MPPEDRHNHRVHGVDIDEIARVMNVIGESTGEALTYDELDDFKAQLGAEGEMKIDEFIDMLTDV